MDRRNQKKQAQMEKIKLGKDFVSSWKVKFVKDQRAEPQVPDWAPLDKWPTPQNIKDSTGKETESGSTNVPVKLSASADILLTEEDKESMESNTAGRERVNLSSSPAHNPSNAQAAAPADPADVEIWMVADELAGDPELAADRRLPVFKNIYNSSGGETSSDSAEKETESGSQESTVFYAPNVPVNHSASADLPSAEE